MILIADGGSTKIRWALVEDRGCVVSEFVTAGLNPLLPPTQGIESCLDGYLRGYVGSDGVTVDEVWYYGAGCLPHVCGDVERALMSVAGCDQVSVASDMLGAARAMCGHEAGVACVLGTGSNSCLYDGRDIADSTPALGFILGDEGSGTVLGRRLVSDVFKRQLPQWLCREFQDRYRLSVSELIDRVYRQPEPNRFLASLAPFIREHIECDGIRDIVMSEFTRFISRNVMNYTGVCDSLPVCFTGSIAVNFAPQLNEAAHRFGINNINIVADQLPGLVKYHFNH